MIKGGIWTVVMSDPYLEPFQCTYRNVSSHLRPHTELTSRQGEQARKLSSFEPVTEVKTGGSNLCNLEEMSLVSGGSFRQYSESQQ